MASELERGDIFYFYRPKVEADKPTDVQRLYIVLANASVYRLLIVGANRLPVSSDRTDSAARRWVLVRAVSRDSHSIESILSGGEYETKTKGTRHLPPAAPVGEGRYAIVKYDGTTQLVHQLRRPKSGKLADTLGLRQEASFVIAVKNPDIRVKGFPDEKPDYPDQLRNLFKDRRWVAVQNSGLLNYKGAQLALISALDDSAAQKLGVDLDEGKDVRPDIEWDLPKEGLLQSRFPDLATFARRRRTPIKTDIGSGGEKGGQRAARASNSASAVATLLSGVELPAAKKAILQRARGNAKQLDDADPALQRLEQLPRKTFRSMSELQKELARKTSKERYPCEICGRVFEDASSYRRHLHTSHPEGAVSAADIEKALKGISYPSDRDALLEHAESKGAGHKILDAIESLPDRSYRDAAEVATAFQESIIGKGRRPRKSPSEKALQSTSAAALAKLLKGIELPAGVSELRKRAESSGADKKLIDLIEAMPKRRYADAADVEKGFAQAKKEAD